MSDSVPSPSSTCSGEDLKAEPMMDSSIHTEVETRSSLNECKDLEGRETGYVISGEQNMQISVKEEEEDWEELNVKIENDDGVEDEEGFWKEEKNEMDEMEGITTDLKFVKDEVKIECGEQEGDEPSMFFTSGVLEQPGVPIYRLEIANNSVAVQSLPSAMSCEGSQGVRSPWNQHELSPLVSDGFLERESQVMTLDRWTDAQSEVSLNQLPSSSENGMAIDDLKERFGKTLNSDALTKHVVCEVYKAARSEPADTPARWLAEWCAITMDDAILERLCVKIKRTWDQSRKLHGAKRAEYLCEHFSFPNSRVAGPFHLPPTIPVRLDNSQEDKYDHGDGEKPGTPTQNENLVSEEVKNNNLTHEILTKIKHLNIVKRAIKEGLDELNGISAMKRCLREPYVEKREANFKSTIAKLRSALRSTKKKVINKDRCIQELEESISCKVRELEKKVRAAEKKVLHERRMKNYKVRVLTEKIPHIGEKRQLKLNPHSGNACISETEDAQSNQKDSRTCPMKSDNAFSEDIRLCVVDLLGLEVGIEKIPLVIQSVAKRLFNTNLAAKDLPSRETVLRISDEAQFLTKVHNEAQMGKSHCYGINGDGTSCKGVKTLKASFTLPSGGVLPSSFRRIAKEDDVSITSNTKLEMAQVSKYAENNIVRVMGDDRAMAADGETVADRVATDDAMDDGGAVADDGGAIADDERAATDSGGTVADSATTGRSHRMAPERNPMKSSVTVCPIVKKAEEVAFRYKGRHPRSPDRGDRVREAMRMVTEEKVSIREAASCYALSYGYLQRRLSGETEIDRRKGPNPVFSPAVETAMASWLSEMTKRGVGLKPREFLDYVQEMVVKSNLETPFKRGRPSYDWYYAFMSRNNNILSRGSEIPLEMSRSKLTNGEFDQWFSRYRGFLISKQLLDKPGRIWNADECVFDMANRSGEVIGPVKSITRGSSKARLTALYCCNAEGDMMPPFLVYPSPKPKGCNPLNGATKGTVIAYTNNGEMKAETFAKFIDFFHANAGPKRPVLLLIDGLCSHMDMTAFRNAMEKGIEIYRLARNATHGLQPLDKGVFGPLKAKWYQVLSRHYGDYPSSTVGKGNFAEKLRDCCNEFYKPSMVSDSFKAAGIYPVDASNIQTAELKPGLPHQETESPEMSAHKPRSENTAVQQRDEKRQRSKRDLEALSSIRSTPVRKLSRRRIDEQYDVV